MIPAGKQAGIPGGVAASDCRYLVTGVDLRLNSASAVGFSDVGSAMNERPTALVPTGKILGD